MSDKRIVYAEDAIKAVHNLYAIFGSEGEWVDRKDVFEAIDSLPSAQPQRTKGRWIDVTKTGGAELWKCSECGELELEDSYFCPNCGADMRGDNNAAD